MSLVLAPNEQCRKCGDLRPIKDGKFAPGWMKLGKTMVCPKCKETWFTTRTVSLPVHSVNMPFREFEALILQQAAAFTDAQNYCAHIYETTDPGITCPKRVDPVVWNKGGQQVTDATRTILVESLPKFKQPELYQSIRIHFPGIAATSVTCVTRRAWQRYQTLRYRIIVENNASPRVRYPDPILVRGANWNLLWEPDETGQEHPHAEMMLGKQTVRFRLCDHPRDYTRQIGFLRKIQEGTAKQGDVTITLTSGSKKDKDSIRTGIGLERSFRKVFVRIAVTFQNAAEATLASEWKPIKDKVLFVKTSPDNLYLLTCDGYVINRKRDTHLLALMARRAKRRLELADDRKGLNSKQRRRLLRKSDAETKKYERRINNSVYNHARIIFREAMRRHCASIVVNDGPVTITDLYRFAAIWERVADLCQEHGIKYDKISVKPIPGTEVSDTEVYADALKERERSMANKELKKYIRDQKMAEYKDKQAQKKSTAETQNSLVAVQNVLKK